MTNIDKKSIRFLARAMILMSLLLAAITLAKAVKYKFGTDGMGEKMKAIVGKSGQNEEEIKKLQEKFTSVVADLKIKSIFAPPTPGKKNPVKKVDAIMGDEALINDAWYKAGDSIGEAKLILVGSAEVTVEWNGKETKLSPISAPTKYAVVAKAEPTKEIAEAKVQTAEEVKQKVIKEAPVAAAEEDDPLSWIGVKMSPELKAIMLKQWNKMTDEQKAEGKKRWESMPDGQKQAMVDQMEMHKDQIGN